jgi:hypothetical protein
MGRQEMEAGKLKWKMEKEMESGSENRKWKTKKERGVGTEMKCEIERKDETE